jgi:crotonobetainyl-CoA:carnitine CoA-transferase CaiB-like acyl-CoA transferase
MRGRCLHDCSGCFRLRGCRVPALETAIGTPAPCHIASMAGYVVIRITERLGGGEPLRTAYAVAEPNQHRAIALFKLRPDHTADEQVEAVVELSQSALDSLGLKPGMIKPL